ncbi:hypothetical protein HMPREF0091_10974 [Fannyhessea vaginae DSM 15829]|uniref:Uncharacterized protein n=1 Tax=Fannyhessea vaginae DSM 15829 TaxID=525256 RepID=F1T674_9ACTN|nr:hypothetical protein HMPREF0091_10974 [Fannyhessea vaginae DSM 15829]
MFDEYTSSIHAYGAANRKNCSKKILPIAGEDLFLSLWVIGQKCVKITAYKHVKPSKLEKKFLILVGGL